MDLTEISSFRLFLFPSLPLPSVPENFTWVICYLEQLEFSGALNFVVGMTDLQCCFPG